ncbi:MAG: hypothetical protein KDA97_02565 [Acidimicrobiales bacterium]|nr:hypothetical protein [Acidimicrobiales bacterium]
MSDATDDGTEDHDERLTDLEDAQAERERRKQLDKRFELYEAVILSIAALLAAWTGFQAAKWGGVQANAYSQAGAARTESTRASTRAGQEASVDVTTFTSWLEAGQDEGAFDDDGYQPEPGTLSGFLYERFRPEFKVAVDAWLATRPGADPEAPPTPFAMDEYVLADGEEADELVQKAERRSAAARQANQRSDNYVLMTIMFATVLFFAGVSSKMDTVKARVFLISAAVIVLVVSIGVILSFPIEV